MSIKNSKIYLMKLIVGLGNYGKEYEHTRHNVGFDTVDLLADSLGESIDKNGFHSLYKKVKYMDEDLLLVKPQTYMNNSGIAVKEIADYFKIDLEDIVVIHDEMDILPGHLKFKMGGKSAGHNGIKSITEHLGSDKYLHIKIGIGKPEYNVIDFVLGKYKGEEKDLIEKSISDAKDAVKLMIKESLNKAMSTYNH